MDIRFIGNVTPYIIHKQAMLHVVIPKKTQLFYGLAYEPTLVKIGEKKINWKETSKKNTMQQVLVTISTTHLENTIIEISDVDKIIARQKKEELVDKKTKQKLEKFYEISKDIHEYALQHPEFQEPPHIKKLFTEPNALEKAIENIVLKAIPKKGENNV